MSLKKSHPITIDGKQYMLKYNINSIIDLESKISTKNMTKLIQSYPFSHTDAVACLYVGLQEDIPSITPKKALRLVEKWLEANTMTELCDVLLMALAKAGAIGKMSLYDETEADEAGKK